MALRSGSFIHDADGIVIDRIQTGGVSGLNIPLEKIKELGNWQTVADIRDTPDLTFDLESFDTSTEVEAIVDFTDPTTVSPGDSFNPKEFVPINVISPFKSNVDAFDIVRGIAVPFLSLESASYRWGVGDNSTERFSFRGDSIFYIPGSPYYEEFSGDGATATFALANTALLYEESGDDIFVLHLDVVESDDTVTRLNFGDDYTNTSGDFTLLDPTVAPAASTLRAVYGSATSATYAQSVHEGTSVKPAAVKGMHVDVYVSDGAATPTLSRWNGIQNAEVNWSVNLEADRELGNPRNVAQTFETAEVNGSITIRPEDPADLFDKINQVANVSSTQISGPFTSEALEIEVRLDDPDTGDRLKTWYISDARFTPPPISGTVDTKIDPTFNWTSDGGNLLVYNGARS
jgi:hypothetical protein